MQIRIYLSLLVLISIFLLIFGIFVQRIKGNKQLKGAFLFLVICMNICNLGYLTAIYAETYYYNNSIVFSYLPFIGQIFIPVAFLLVGIIFAKNHVVFNIRYLGLFIVPVLSVILMLTNNNHGLFFKGYNSFSDISYGTYFNNVHLPFTYICVGIGLFLLISYSVKNSGFFSKQALLLVAGSIIPLGVNMLWVIGNILNNEFLKLHSKYDLLPISFSVSIIFVGIGIMKFDFLNIVPIALQKIVDIISDSYIVIDREYKILDYNKTFQDTFAGVFAYKRKDDFFEIAKAGQVGLDTSKLERSVENAVKNYESISFEQHFSTPNIDKFFLVEVTPIFSDKSDKKHVILGIIILLKDITEHKKNIEALKQQQTVILEQERLASLGQLIGGIAHNLKTPIMSLSGGMEALKDLVAEYKDSIDDDEVTIDDHKEIADEMREWLEKMKPYCSYMSDVISAVKGQAVQMIATSNNKFTIDELMKRVHLLMKQELKKYHCILNVDCKVDMSAEIKGEVSNLVQVFDNIIINAMHAYEGKGGVIDLKIREIEDNIEFAFRDYGKGIPEPIANRLFKEMVTTKGKKGNGLGLYMSYSTVVGRFGGNMTFTSHVGFGSTFYITVPYITHTKRRDDIEEEGK